MPHHEDEPGFKVYADDFVGEVRGYLLHSWILRALRSRNSPVQVVGDLATRNRHYLGLAITTYHVFTAPQLESGMDGVTKVMESVCPGVVPVARAEPSTKEPGILTFTARDVSTLVKFYPSVIIARLAFQEEFQRSRNIR